MGIVKGFHHPFVCRELDTHSAEARRGVGRPRSQGEWEVPAIVSWRGKGAGHWGPGAGATCGSWNHRRPVLGAMERSQPQPEALPTPPMLLPFSCLQLTQEPGKRTLRAHCHPHPATQGRRGIDLRAHGARTGPWPFHLGIAIAHPVPDTDPGSIAVCEQVTDCRGRSAQCHTH